MPDPGSSVQQQAEAVRLIRMLAHARRARIEPRVQTDLDELGYDVEDVLSCLVTIDVKEIHKEEPDEKLSDKMVYVFRKRYEERVLYVKVSIRLPKDHDLKILSFKNWS